MDVEIRTAEDGDYPLVCSIRDAGFPDAKGELDLPEMKPLFEADRTLLARIGEATVGTVSAYSFEMAVPGATLATAGVAGVAVLPTHRRRGVLSAMMTSQLAEVASRGDVVAALWASESGIYGRFGYGPASTMAHLSLPHYRSEFRPDIEVGGELRFVAVDAAEAAIAPVHERAGPTIPGSFARDPRWWRHVLCDTPYHRGQDSPLACVVHSAAGVDDGYLLYRRRHDKASQLPDGTVSVVELVGENPVATASLWRFCFDLDLMVRTEAPCRMAADPLRLLLAQPRWLEARTSDGLYVRVLDVGAGLAARGYALEDDLVIAVTDPMIASNEGTWLLEARVDGAACRRSDRRADLEVDVADIGAAYLGRSRFAALAGVGRVRELTPSAASRADAVFAWPVEPWCPTEF